MKDQLQTIREFIESVHEGEWAPYAGRYEALTALSELERLAGEPVAKLHDDGYWTPMKTETGRALSERLMLAGSPPVEVYTATPPAQQPQYEAADMASAAAQGFRDGVASVAQQPDHITPAELAKRIERGEKWEVAQQPQARPDFTDEWTGYLKDGETPFERFLRERKDLSALTKLYQRAIEENERLKAQQPQAEVGNSEFDHKTAADFLSGKTVSDEAVRKFVQASRWAHDDRASLQSMLHSVRNELASREAEIALLKKELMEAEAAPQQAEAGQYTRADIDRAYSAGLVEGERLAIQQAEAAPSDVVRGAAPIPGHELVTMYDERPTSDLEMIEFAREVERRHGIGVQPQHITDGSPCWCNPDVAYTDPETGASVIVHRRPQ